MIWKTSYTVGTQGLLVKALILVIGENECIARNTEGATSVLLSQSPNRIVLGRNINRFTLRSIRFSHQNRSSMHTPNSPSLVKIQINP